MEEAEVQLTPQQEQRLAAAEAAMAELRLAVAQLISALITEGRLNLTEDFRATLEREGLPMPKVAP